MHNTSRAPCGLQRQIAQQNTYIDDALGKLSQGTSYAAPCDVSGAKAPASPLS